MTQEHRYAQGSLDHFLDGELPDAERLALEEHLGRCDDCLAELDGLRALRDAARSLPREIGPPRDLWAGIAARIEAEPARAEARVVEVDFAARRRTVPSVWMIRIAAAMTLVVVSSGVTALLLRGSGEGTEVAAGLPATTVTQPAPRPEAAVPTALAAFEPTEREYLGAVEVLAVELEARKADLAPETVATVEQSLRIIDRAIAEARVALERDPANADLPFLLSGVYRKKVDLLQQAVELPRGS
jgi:anti-sigma factor RsiW